MFHLLHISDVHLTPFVPPTMGQLLSKRITGWLNWKLNRTHALGERVLANLREDWQQYQMQHVAQAQHLVISGDLVNLSLPDEFAQAREWIAGLGKPADISLVFGNHDAYVPGALKQACRIFSPWISSDGPETDAPPFPYCRIRDEIALIGVNSAVATMPFSARGTFDKKQAWQLAEILRDTAEQKLFRIVAIHHPPLYHATSYHKKLTGIRRFQAVVAKQGAELILHGHTHRPTLEFIKGRAGVAVPIVGVASISQAFDGHRPPANYNIFQIEREGKGWRCLLIRRGLVNAQNHIAETMRQELYP